MKKQRDRGRRKKHHGPRSEESAEASKLAPFVAWLAETYPLEPEGVGGPATSISLTRFLQDAADFDFSSQEKLRELAIHWEEGCVVMSQPTGWHLLRQIYDEAIRIDPHWSMLYHSKSLAARACAALAFDPPIKKALLADSLRACHEGLSVDSEEGLLHNSLGMTLYKQGAATEEALASFEAAIACESEQVWWSQLYRAHCLHDLQRWVEAADAYRRVDRGRFNGATAWRGHLVREQLAHCLYFAGETQESESLFTAVVEAYEADPESLDNARYIEAAAEFFPQLGARIDALLRAQGLDRAPDQP